MYPAVPSSTDYLINSMSVVPSQRWIEQQRGRPSFVVAGRDAQDIAFEHTLLHMPASLQSIALPPAAAYSAAATNSPLSVPVSSPRRLAAARAATPPSRSVGTPARAHSPGAGQATTPIHERLLQRGQLYEQRLEALRERAIHNEVRRCRSVPKISSMGHNIQRDSAIEVRLANVAEEKKQVGLFNIQIMEKRERGIIEKWFHPQISAKGKRSTGKAKKEKQKLLHETWEYKRQQRIEELRKEKIVKELGDVRGMPDIDPRSELLAARRREKEGMAGYTHLEAMLERDRLAKLARWEEQQRAAQAATIASPKITTFAATMRRSGDVADRLMAEAAAREERRLERERLYLEEERGGQGGTPGREFRPDELLARHQLAVQRRDERIRQVHANESRMHNPTINPTSDHLASRMSQSTMERLTTPPRSRTPGRSEQQQPRSTTPRSVRGGGEDSNLFERLQLAEARRKLHIEAAKSEKEAKELEACTFAPATTVNYYPPAQADTPRGVYERMKQWDQRRQDRIDEQRKRGAAEELDGYTFAPRINAAQNSNFSTDNISGFQDFVTRQQSAARQRPEGDRPPAQHDGSHRQASTTPQAPLLGRERDAVAPGRAPVVLSLQRPVPVPSMADYGTPSQQRYSLSGQQQASNASQIAHSYLRSAPGAGGGDPHDAIPARDTVSLDSDEHYPPSGRGLGH
jgi:hypothetical protein